jgi:hypothetical protein
MLARLGVRSLVELIGRTDLLEALPGETERQRKLDLAACCPTAVCRRQAAVLPGRRAAQRALRQGRAGRADGADALPAIDHRQRRRVPLRR